MSQSKTKNAAEDLMASLMEELNLSAENSDDEAGSVVLNDYDSLDFSIDENENIELDLNQQPNINPIQAFESTDDKPTLISNDDIHLLDTVQNHVNANDATVALPHVQIDSANLSPNLDANLNTDISHNSSDSEKTVAIAGYSDRNEQGQDNNVKVSVGQSRSAFSSGYASWGNSDSQLAQADNLRIAQEKILEIENENEKLRMQTEELIAASEIVKERADLLTSQVQEFKSDRDGLEQSYKNEMQLIKNQFHRKDNELQKAQIKIDELDSRLKFDMKKIRIRERELENRLELVRAEKNALVKSKDEQILDLRRKMDQVQLEVESYRQKCVDLNKVLDTNQDSFKRTTRALRLAMANLELQDENKIPLRKVD